MTCYVLACVYVCICVCACVAIFLGRPLNVNNVVEVLNDGDFPAAECEILGTKLNIKQSVMANIRSDRSGQVEF